MPKYIKLPDTAWNILKVFFTVHKLIIVLGFPPKLMFVSTDQFIFFFSLYHRSVFLLLFFKGSGIFYVSQSEQIQSLEEDQERMPNIQSLHNPYHPLHRIYGGSYKRWRWILARTFEENRIKNILQKIQANDFNCQLCGKTSRMKLHMHQKQNDVTNYQCTRF